MTFWKTCLNTSTIKPTPLLEKIRVTAEAGFDAIELWINDLYEHVGRGGEVRDVESALQDHGLTVPCMIALRGWGEAVGPEYGIMLDEARRRMELAARIGSPLVVATPPRQACELSQLTDRYGDLLRLGREFGVRPTFEYISFFEGAQTLDVAWQVVQNVGEEDATLIADAFHTWNSHSNAQLLQTIPGQRISHYHIDDGNPALPRYQQTDPDRVMIGEGVIDLAGEIEMLQQIGYNGMISLELFNHTLWQQDPLEVARLGKQRLDALLQL
tara:strand:+ start:10617 stop:11429 length:813 start_codon:yes stop_codon:yes gene_type:complete